MRTLDIPRSEMAAVLSGSLQTIPQGFSGDTSAADALEEAGPLSFDASYWAVIAKAVQQQFFLAQQNIRTISSKLKAGNAWDTARAQLSPRLRDPNNISDCLMKAGAAYRLADIGCSKEQFYDAVRQCACMRERLTSIDLGFTLGILPNQSEDIVEECSQ